MLPQAAHQQRPMTQTPPSTRKTQRQSRRLSWQQVSDYTQRVPYLLWLNPTDVFRIFVYMIVGSSNLTGVLSIADQGANGLIHLSVVMLAWVGLPLMLSAWILKRKELS